MRACTPQELRCGCQQLELRFVLAAGVAQAYMSDADEDAAGCCVHTGAVLFTF